MSDRDAARFSAVVVAAWALVSAAAILTAFRYWGAAAALVCATVPLATVLGTCAIAFAGPGDDEDEDDDERG